VLFDEYEVAALTDKASFTEHNVPVLTNKFSLKTRIELLQKTTF
jgi:hypothetical protein